MSLPGQCQQCQWRDEDVDKLLSVESLKRTRRPATAAGGPGTAAAGRVCMQVRGQKNISAFPPAARGLEMELEALRGTRGSGSAETRES